MFSATVTTTVLLDGKVHLQDKIVFSDIDEKVIGFLDGSCKLAMSKLLRDQTKADGGYSLHYHTVIVNSSVGLAVGKRPPITVTGLTKSQIHAFLSFAMLELSRMNNLRYGDSDVSAA